MTVIAAMKVERFMQEPRKYSFVIRNTETDVEDTLHLQALFSMLQESASTDAAVYGWGADRMDSLGLCWLLTRISLRMKKMPSWQNTIIVETWSRGPDRLFFLRDFIIWSSEGEQLGVASSMWIVVDKENHRPVRPDAIMEYSKIPSDHRKVFDFTPPKLTPFSDADSGSVHEGESTLVKYADFSEIDRNKHVNNTRYIAWCVDAFYKDKENLQRISGVDINFLSEIYFGSKIHLFSNSESAGGTQIDGYVSGSQKPAFSAVLYTGEV